MKLTRFIETLFRRYLPSPFTIAILLTVLTVFLALIFADLPEDENRIVVILGFWEEGIWNTGLLVFAYQMMLILVLGHVLVLSKPMEKLIHRLSHFVKNTANAALLVASTTMIVSFFNWGLGLIFGALLARKVAEYAQARNIPLNYPLIGAAGYTGLMVWHGGISGSAPIKVSEKGHLKELMASFGSPELISALPEYLPSSETVFSSWNLLIFATVVLLISLLAYRLGKTVRPTKLNLTTFKFKDHEDEIPRGAEKLDRSVVLSTVVGVFILLVFGLRYSSMITSLNITPNMLNLFMLGLALVLHGSFRNFLLAIEEAIGDTSGILIQFPLYFGIMGIMGNSGMISGISDFFISISNETTMPIFTFFSGGLVNIFVPSGGGQWAVQGPLVLESALRLGVPLPKAVMALAYGDQITNMLQPFWALPLLGITKLKAKEILPYTLLFMFVGTLVYVTGLLLV
ncbi:MAG: TIGR00366 family protein [Flavobacteriaceae bacterium]